MASEHRGALLVTTIFTSLYIRAGYSIVISMRDQHNLPVYKQQAQKWAVLKAQAEHEAGRPLSWGAFLEKVFAVYEASMDANEAESNEDANAMRGRTVNLSDASCERIAEQLAAKLDDLGRRTR